MSRASTPAGWDTSVPAVVLKLYHHGSLGAVRTLGRLGVPVFGVHEDQRAPTPRSRYLRETLEWNIDTARDDASVEKLLGFAARIGGRPVLITTDDRSGDFLADNAEALRDAYRFPDQPAGLTRALADKESLYGLCLEHGIPAPHTAFPKSRRELLEMLPDASYPLVLKGIDAWRLERRCGLRLAIVHDESELLERYDFMEDPESPNLMVQEYIPGDPQTVWMLDGYFDADSECRVAFTGQKLRQYPAYTGMTSLGICRPNPQVQEMTRDFMKRLGYRGVLDLGYRFDARDGLYKLLDVNPRLGATFRLFAGADDMDMVRALYLDATGQPIPPSEAVDGRKWVVENYDLRSSVTYWRDGELKPLDWLRSFRGVNEAGWLALDDPKPFAAMARESVRHLTRRERPGTAGQGRVDDYFDRVSDYWETVYEEDDVQGLIYRERLRRANDWIGDLGLAPGSGVLEIGCGAGAMSVALARRGFDVQAMDSVPAMVERARRHVEAQGFSDRVTLSIGDAHALDHVAGAFDLVVALGVVPWLHSPGPAVEEMSRVLRPGGYLLLTADNRIRLNHLLDPRLNPGLGSTRIALRPLAARLGLPTNDDPEGFEATMHRRRELERLATGARLELVRYTTVGFGPFSLLGRPTFDERVGQRVHGRLQRLADGGVPGIRSLGSHLMLLARKPHETL
jgi:predicted ATP-grasp superfamily ATP-dependent carboligase/SAM-dependent methyltransferase